MAPNDPVFTRPLLTRDPKSMEYWQRMDALFATLQAIKKAIPDDVHRKDAIECLIGNLEVFAVGQFEYFNKRFLANESAPDGFSDEQALSRIIVQISADLDVIKRVLQDRAIGSKAIMDKLSPDQQALGKAYVETLDIADKLAYQALKPAIDPKEGGMFPQDLQIKIENAEPTRPTVLTYFQKSVSIRLIPYAPIALIGIPFSCMRLPEYVALGAAKPKNAKKVKERFVSVAQDFMAIPHEMGHYLYWNGTPRLTRELINSLSIPLEDEVLDELAKSPYPITVNQLLQAALATPGFVTKSYSLKWAEEIFADIYGCLIAGPYIAKSAQDRQITGRSRDELLKDDGDHPLPAVRPQLFVDTLKSQLLNEYDWAEAFRKLWIERRRKRGINDDKLFIINGTTDKASVIDAQLEVPRIEYKCYELLEHLRLSVDTIPECNFWRKACKAVSRQPDLMDKLYEHLADSIETFKNAEPPPEVQCPIANWEELKTRWIERDRRLQILLGGAATAKENADREWQVILSAGGWADEGPPSNPPKGD
jgi:hypothetical protein